ncbi:MULTISPECIES: hypothetical protein [Roseomonadaceae]|uniref:Uncharacterized protein n=1 Tax=Falsiroseomonas oleicola TaxID=2801474 RepID=A0ABS6HF26_9PROT|nr:hypothetical protein [Roseomonas oleicola]MBU8547263.1 hypothetical protein [Roseomonas oleicola]
MTATQPVEEDLRALKTAFRRLIGAVGGLVAASACVRVSTSQLARYYDLNDLGTFPPIDVVTQLERIAGEPIVAVEQARLTGHRLVPERARDGATLAAEVAAFARAAGEVPAALCEALADGEMSQAEADAIGAVAMRLAAKLARVTVAAEAAVSSPAAPAVKGEGAPADRRPLGGDGGGRLSPRRGRR